MTLLMDATDVVGLPVVSIADGEDVAEVRDVIYDPAAGRVIGLTLNKRGFLSGRSKDVLTIDGVYAIGRHAVMVADSSALISTSEAPQDVATPPTERNVLGNDVLTEAGVSLGRVRDLVLVVGGDGHVVGYQIDKAGGGSAYIPLPAQVAVSGAALVVPEATAEFVRDDLVGLGAAVDEFRDRIGL